MFESIQDYLCQEIDKNKLLENMVLCKEYQNGSPEVKEGIDIFIEELKEAKDEKEFIYKLTNNVIFNNLKIELEDIDVFNLATRTCGGPVPNIEPPILLGFIDAAMDEKDDERVFRLAYNYDDMLLDKSIIEDYYISNKNAFYINELACNDFININLEKLVNALIALEDKEELKYFAEHTNNEQYRFKVLEKLKELDS